MRETSLFKSHDPEVDARDGSYGDGVVGGDSHMRRWQEETGSSPEENLLMTILISLLMVHLPKSVKCKLGEAVNIILISRAEFGDHDMHAVGKHRKSEQKAKEQEKEMLKNVARLKGELTESGKKTEKIQASTLMKN